jgi:hypothetical protein
MSREARKVDAMVQSQLAVGGLGKFVRISNTYGSDPR